MKTKYRGNFKKAYIFAAIYLLFDLLAVMNRHPQISEFEQYVIDFVIDLRKTKDLTQKDMGNILKLSREFVRDVENPKSPAKYNMDHVNAFADYFGMSPREFFPQKPFPVD